MPTLTAPTALPPVAAIDAASLIADIEAYLAEQASTRTAHPLVTKTTDQLIAEALRGPDIPAATAPNLAGPHRLWRIIPDWALAITPARRLHGAGRQVTVTQHLELTALVIQQYGWHRGRLRSRSGARCILGAQAVLYRLGYGDESTAQAAGQQLQNILRRRGIDEPYHRWNDRPERTLDDALHLIREAINHTKENS
jgi:hypothetical protein